MKVIQKHVFNQIKNLPMVMVMLYASLGSVLLREFGLQPFIVEISGSTSTGKTFTLNLVSSVWGQVILLLHGVLRRTVLKLWHHF